MRPARLAVAATLVLPAVTGLIPTPGGAASPVPAHFGTPVVVDHFRPGYEPDAAVDPRTGQIFASTPFGFSTTASFIYRSDDHGASYHLTEGNALVGKPLTCVGGGDTELQINPHDSTMYFSDLQGLTDFSNSVSTDAGKTFTTSCTAVTQGGVDRQWLAIDTNGGSSSVGGGAGDARVYFDYDQIFQSLSQPGGNKLVINESLDGVNFGSGCVTPSVPCPVPIPAITADEGIGGNMLVDNTPGGTFQHSVYAIHSSRDGGSVIVSVCRNKPADTAAIAAARCTDGTAVDTNDISTAWHDVFPRKATVDSGSNVRDAIDKNFAALAIDTAGNLYATWADLPKDASGNVNGPGIIRVAYSTDGGEHWSAPVQVSPSGLGTNVFPWIAAGTPGHIAVAWYGAPQAAEAGSFGPDTLNHGTWNVYFAQATNLLNGGGTSLSLVSDHQVKFGNISTAGLGGSPDRSLGDFMQVQMEPDGRAVVVYVDDTSANRNPDFSQGSGQTPAEAAGPIMMAIQDGGPTLTGGDLGTAPTPAYGSVTDPVNGGSTLDAFYSANGSDTAAPGSLDIKSVAVTQPDAAHLTFSLDANDPALASDLGPNPTLGGLVNDWVIRWAQPTRGGQGDGNIFYVGMESALGGAPTFYDGTTRAIVTTHTKFFLYPPENTATGAIKGSTISWTVPLSDFPGLQTGDTMYSVTGFTATQLLPGNDTLATIAGAVNSGGLGSIDNLIDAATPFTYRVGFPTAGFTPTPGGGSTTATSAGSPSPNTSGGVVQGVAAGLAAVAVLAAAVGARRRRS